MITKWSKRDTVFDRCVILSALSILCILFANLSVNTDDNEDSDVPGVQAEVDGHDMRSLLSIGKDLQRHIHREAIPYDDAEDAEDLRAVLEEEPGDEFNCLFYATVPIGKYFITAYNDEETACKTTASGTKCHEGTITTCAADVGGGYFKFGDYIEVDGKLYVVEDTGSAVKNRHIDLFFDSYKDMARYNTNYQVIYRVEFPFGKPGYA